MSQRVFITAGAGGIGRVIAQAYADQGAQVYLCDQDEAALADLPEAMIGAKVNVTDETALGAWLQAGLDTLGGCDVLINNAGVAGQADPVEKLDLAQWKQWNSMLPKREQHRQVPVTPEPTEEQLEELVKKAHLNGLTYYTRDNALDDVMLEASLKNLLPMELIHSK